MTTQVAKHIPKAMNELIIAIKTEIERQGLSMSSAAELAGITRPYLYRILNREAVPSVDLAERIANGFGLTLRICKK